MSGSIWFGDHVADDGELRLCGDIVGKRAIELGIAPAVERAGDGRRPAPSRSPSTRPPAAIAALRAAAERAEVRVECHQGDLADLGFATSGSVDLVVAAHSWTASTTCPACCARCTGCSSPARRSSSP